MQLVLANHANTADVYKRQEYHYYYCPTGKKNGCASSVMLKEDDLIECVQDSLKGHIENVASLDSLLSSISQERINRELAQEYAGQIRANEKQLAQIEGCLLYTSRALVAL